MNIIFRINYRATWGENLAVVLLHDAQNPIMLSTADGERWEGGVSLKEAPEHLYYKYCVMRDGKLVREEQGRQPHALLCTSDAGVNYIVNDAWRDLPQCSYLFTCAFSGPSVKVDKVREAHSTALILRVLCPTLHLKHQVLGIVGASSALGKWRTALRMQETITNQWQISLPIDILEESDYKFVALNEKTGAIEEWEGGENRHLYVPSLNGNVCYCLTEEEVYMPSTAQKVAGSAVPVFSLRSKGSQGVGDFGDLKAFIDWAIRTQQRAVQILPINDTTKAGLYTDSYPYSSISIYAFHPMYVDLRQLSMVKDARGAEILRELSKLNEQNAVDYPAVNALKHEYLHLLFAQESKKTLASKAYKAFAKDNIDWLKPYAAFCLLRDKFGTPCFAEWKTYSTYTEAKIKALEKSNADAINYYAWVQYLLHCQLKATCDYAREHGVIIKGDIPIGIDRNSVEAWKEPHLFNMNGSAGAPPDAFSTKGQNWGFPTYNWEEMAKDGYAWWKRRFRKMAEYFSAYRIDHILGFFRIWEIPTHSVHGLLGQFSPAMPMTAEEIMSWGLHFQEDFMTQPFINDELVRQTFGDEADRVKKTYLKHAHDDIYVLLPEYSTQRKIEAAKEEDWVKEGLYSLVSNVLFVRDKNGRGWHPRIAVQNDYIFWRLSNEERDAFNRLYNHYYYERHNQFWYHQAMQKLPSLLQSADLLPCGEDLGMVPDCVPWVMNQLQIMSLEIERMPKNPEYEFGHVNEYPYRSVCTIGTHDMSTFRGWWEEDTQLTQRYWNNVLGGWGNATPKASAEVCEQVVRRHLESPSLLCILALQDWLAIDAKLRLPDANAERINVPANPKHYWQYRMHITIEELMRAGNLNSKVAGLILSTRK